MTRHILTDRYTEVEMKILATEINNERQKYLEETTRAKMEYTAAQTVDDVQGGDGDWADIPFNWTPHG